MALCNAQRRSGGTCRQAAGWGTSHAGYGACKLHGGSTPAATTYASILAQPDRARQIFRALGLTDWKPLPESDVSAMEAVISGGRHDTRGVQEARARVFCGARTRQGDHGPCRRPAGWGTSHVGCGQCKLHGGATRNGVRHAYALAAELETFQVMARMTRERATPTAELLLHKYWVDINGRSSTEAEA